MRNAIRLPVRTSLRFLVDHIDCDAGIVAYHDRRLRIVQERDDPANHQCARRDAREQPDLLPPRRCANEVAGLQVLACGRRHRCGDAHHTADRQRERPVLDIGPSRREKEQRREEHRGHRHPRDRIRRCADLAGDAARHGHKQEGEEQREQRTDRAEVNGRNDHHRDHAQHDSAKHQRHRQVARRALHVAGVSRATTETRQPLRERTHDRRQRAHQRDDPRRRHRAGPDIKDVVRTNRGRIHVGDQRGGRENRRGEPRTEQLDRRDQDEVRQDATGKQVPRDLWSDDVADAGELRAHLGANLAEQFRLPVRQQSREHMPGYFAPEVHAAVEKLVQHAKAEAHEDRARLRPALLAHDQHLGTRRPFRILEALVLPHDQRLAQGYHEQHAEQPAHQRDRGDVPVGKLVAQQQQRREREGDPCRDGLASGARRLHDVVAQDLRSLHTHRLRDRPKDRDRQDRDRDARADGQRHLEGEVHARRREQQSQKAADHHGHDGQLDRIVVGADVRLVRVLDLVHARRLAWREADLLCGARIVHLRSVVREADDRVRGSA